jgi:hypothetical protein
MGLPGIAGKAVNYGRYRQREADIGHHSAAPHRGRIKVLGLIARRAPTHGRNGGVADSLAMASKLRGTDHPEPYLTEDTTDD